MLNLLLALLFSFQEQQIPQFPANQGAINDFANILTEDDKTKLRNECAALRDSGGAAVVVVTTPSLYGLNVEDYANQLFKKWGIGNKKGDNGVLILIAPNERKARIEVGYGNEAHLTDLEAKAILTDVVRPLFREGKISESVVAGTRAVLAKLSGPPVVGPREESVPIQSIPTDYSWLKLILGAIGLILLVWFLVWSGLGEVFLMAMASSGGGSRSSGGGGSSWGGGGSSGGSRGESSSRGGGSSGGGGASSDL